MILKGSKSDIVIDDRDNLLTIIIPTFNGEATIERAISSVIREIESSRLENFIKVLIADNCSTDSTSAVITRMAEGKNFIVTCKTNANGSLYDNLQMAFDIVTTRYAKILCDDDLLMTGYIRHLITILETNPDVDLILSTMEELGKSKSEPLRIKSARVSKFNSNADFISATNGAYGQVSTLCFRTSSWHEGKDSPLLRGHRDRGMEWIARFYHIAMHGNCLFDDSALMENDQGPKRWNEGYMDLFKVNCAHMLFIFQMDSLSFQEFPDRHKWQKWIIDSKKRMTRQLVIDIISLRRNSIPVRDKKVLFYVPSVLRENRYFFCFTKIIDLTPKFICTLIVRLNFVLGKAKSRFKNL
jgi:glycosyltransferase involved in cell wall biosynthesis